MGCCSSKRAVSPADSVDALIEASTSNEDIRDKYELGKVLGSGSFGQVREATLKESPSEVRAVKMIERDNEDGEWSNKAIFVREVGLLKQIKHENIIQYFDVYADSDFLYVVMELCAGGEVFAKIIELKRFSEHDAAVIGAQMLRAIDYIHKVNIIHRDIKAENFMLAQPTWPSAVKMIDFGMACRFQADQVLTELCGSPHYLAPELIGQRYNHLADVWAFGVLMYLIMYGRYPYDAKQPRDIMVKILTEPIQWSTKVKLSQEASSFLKSLLEHSPKKRLTAEAALQHSWIISKANETEKEVEALPTEVVRNAHRKVTQLRKQVDPKVEQIRNRKLQKIDEEYSLGISRGKRLGETPTSEDFLSKPEFMRRENKLYTAPSMHLNTEPTEPAGPTEPRVNPKQVDRQDSHNSTGSPGSNVSPRLKAVESDRLPKTPQSHRTASDRRRCQSLSSMPRRLSYIGNISNNEEKNLAALYEEKRAVAAPSAEDASPRTPKSRGVAAQPSAFSGVVATEADTELR